VITNNLPANATGSMGGGSLYVTEVMAPSKRLALIQTLRLP
jgi:hypothetical protein